MNSKITRQRATAITGSLVALAMAGMVAGTTSSCASHKSAETKASVGSMEKHACKGMNSCKGMGGCQGSANGCSGKNTCKGMGGCATADKHGCKGMNACKGQGGCNSGNNGCAGKNSCKGMGGCAVPVHH